jgi:N-6 DNA Methylase
VQTKPELLGMCLALIGGNGSLSASERRLLAGTHLAPIDPRMVEVVRRAIRRGADPLGEAFSLIHSPKERRVSGAIYTPHSIVRSMVSWLSTQAKPERIVDPGAGSGRFILAAGKAFPLAHLVAVELNPFAALILRANLDAYGWRFRTTVLVDDYRAVNLPPFEGRTAFIGNPPYVRHHEISIQWKVWYAASFAKLGINASNLAGLHLHFFLQTRLLAKNGDIGAFITSAEWMDVNYGSALRKLLIEELGCVALHVLKPTVEAFPGTATTASISCFRIGEFKNPLRIRSVVNLGRLNGLTKGVLVGREKLRTEQRWSTFVRPSTADVGGIIELGELFRVHRGQVTGANRIWISGEHTEGLPDRVKLPCVTKAKDLIQAGANLRTVDVLRRVIDLPLALDGFSREEMRRIAKFLAWAKFHGADQSYIAQHRKAWWSVGLKAPAPILCTYMARRAPQFTFNACAARHINIAHGLYPRQALTTGVLNRLVAWLNLNIGIGGGRTYSGGLTKFEPREIERLRIPTLETLSA